MCTDNKICNLTKKKPLLYCLLFGLYEISYIYIILLIIFLTLYNYKLYKILHIISFIIILYLYNDKYINKVSSGISKLFSLYLFIFLVLFNIIIKFILPKCRIN